MSPLMTTILVAFIITLVAIALLSIGWLFTGKSHLRKGACGRDPHKAQDKECSTGGSCDLCERQNPSKHSDDKAKH